MSLRVVQIGKDEANAYVERLHRHSAPVVQHKWSIAAITDSGLIVGVAITERPKARGLDNGWVVEVTRVCTDGYRNACSFLYGASWRIAREFGYLRAVTYIREDEDGASVRAAGWLREADVRGRPWGCPSRPRDEGHHEVVGRVRYGARSNEWRDDLPVRSRISVAAVEVPNLFDGLDLAA